MERTPHILVVDDHRDIRDLLARFLAKHGLRASVAESAAAARKTLAAADIDLVVLDIMMPGEDGLSLTRFLRESTDIPVILLTAMGEETDRIVGLEIGADDYRRQALQSARAAGADQGGAAPRAERCRAPRERKGASSPSTAGRSISAAASWSTTRASPCRFRAANSVCSPRCVERPGMVLDPRPAARPDARALGAALRPLDRQPDQPAPQEDRARPAHAGADQDRVGRRLQLRRRGQRAMRLWPRSLAGRLAALLILTLVAAQIAVASRSSPASASRRSAAPIARTSSSAWSRWSSFSTSRRRICRRRVLAATSSPLFRVTLDPQPDRRRRSDAQRRGLNAGLAAAMQQAGGRRARRARRAAVARVARPTTMTATAGAGIIRRPGCAPRSSIADGRWLNAAADRPPVPPLGRPSSPPS